MNNSNLKEYPSFYTIIPSYIRYNKKLTYFEMILYSEIVALSNKYGYSFASNSYFANVFDKSSKSISRSINKMIDLNLLKAEIDKEGGNKRKLYITLYENNDLLREEPESKSVNEDTMDKNVYSPMDNHVDTPIDKNAHTPMDKNVYHNNIKELNTIKVNNINNNMSIRASSNNTRLQQQPLNPFFKKRSNKYKSQKKSTTKTDVNIDWLDEYMIENGLSADGEPQVDWLNKYL